MLYHGASSRCQVRVDGDGAGGGARRVGHPRPAAAARLAGAARLAARQQRGRSRRTEPCCAPVATFFHGRNAFYVSLLLLPPLLWLGTVYLGSLFALLMQSFYAIDEFTARIVPEFTLATYRQLVTHPANVDIVAAHARDGHRGHDRLRHRRVPGRELHGALRRARR